eukprot:tig00021290_g19991.t1
MGYTGQGEPKGLDFKSDITHARGEGNANIGIEYGAVGRLHAHICSRWHREAVAEATAKKEAAYADYAKKVDKANDCPVYPKTRLCMQCYRFLDDRGLLANLGLQRRKRGDTTAVSAQAQNQMAQTVLAPKTKASKSPRYGRAFGQSPSRRFGQEKIRKQDIAAPT